MAIDFMVMPLSRYVSGDFITPAMRFAWDQGLSYTVIGPEGEIEYPMGIPFGGADAPKRRAECIPMVLEDLRAHSTISSELWDEASKHEPCFHRVDPSSFEELRRLLRELAPSIHLEAELFLPFDFASPFAMNAPLKTTAGSVPRAFQELESRQWNELAQPAALTLADALVDSKRLRLPLILDW